MARILLAWELGENLGHLVPMALLSRALQAAGHTTALAVRELHRAHEVLDADERSRLFAAPVAGRAAGSAPAVQHSYTHMLWASGFADADHVANRFSAWQNLFRAVQAELVIAKHAPTASLAARLSGLPVVAVGSGFQVPRLDDPMPPFRPWLKLPAETLRDVDRAVLEVIRGAVQRVGGQLPATLVEALTPTAQRLLTCRELDHDPARPAATVYWRCLNEIGGERPPAFEGPQRQALLYLTAGYRLNEAIVGTLRTLGFTVHVYGVGHGAPAAALRDLGAIVCAQPIDLAWALARCDLLVCHGGTATIELGLRHGVPMLLCPTHIEQYMVSMRARELGSAEVLVAEQADADPVPALHRLVGDAGVRDAAAAAAARFGPESQAKTLVRLAASITDFC